MSTAIAALKEAVELEKSALEKIRTAISSTKHEQTKSVLEKHVAEKEQNIDSLTWMVMAESGEIQPEPMTEEEIAEAKPAGKCPFTGQLAEMGIDITKMGGKPEGMPGHE